MPRSSKKKKSKSSYRCEICKMEFTLLQDFKDHFEETKHANCKEQHKLKCDHCSTIFHKKQFLNAHFRENVSCRNFEQHKPILSGALQINKVTHVSETNLYSSIDDDNHEFEVGNQQHNSDEDVLCNERNLLLSKKRTYSQVISIEKKSPINIQINVYDDTIQRRNELLSKNNNTTNHNLILNNRIVASLESSKPQMMLNFDDNDHTKILENPSTHHQPKKEIAIDYSVLDEQYHIIEDCDINTEQGCVPSSQSIRDFISNRIEAEIDMSTLREDELNDCFEETSQTSEISCSLTIPEVDDDVEERKSPDHSNTNMNDIKANTNQNTHRPSTSTSFIDGCSVQNHLSKHCENFKLDEYEQMCIDLYQTLRSSNAPLGLYDKIITWVQNHQQTLQSKPASKVLPRREKLIKLINQKVYHNPLFGQPRVSHIQLSSGRQTSVVTFSMKDIILKLVTNKSLFTKDNILLDINEPRSYPPDSRFYSEVNTGSWHSNALFEETGRFPDDELQTSDVNKKLLMPWTFFIDGLKTDKLGKITVEAVLTSCLWLNKNTRNRSSAWDVLGFVEDQKLFRDSRMYIRDEKAQDYHDMMSHIFKEFKQIYDCGGMKVNLDFRHCGGQNLGEYVLIPVIQYIIGDCKGNDLLCGRMAGHSLKMKGACRDCFISPPNLDYIPDDNEQLICKFITQEDIEGKEKAYLKSKSFLGISNAFCHLSFGGCDRGIWGATPVEILHAVQLGLCEYLCESFEHFIFPNSAFNDIMSKTASGIAVDSQRQSERDMPSLSPFRYGLVSISSLKATERFARVFSIFLTLSNTHCIKALMKQPTKTDRKVKFSLDKLRALFSTVEELLIYHQWLKEDKYQKSDFVDRDDGTLCRAMCRVICFMKKFKKHLPRSGNCLKTIKFHQMLHIVDYIKRFGAPSNWDGSRGEHFGKTLVKDNAKLTNRRKETLNYDISRRVSEGSVIDRSCRLHFENQNKWLSRYCNDTDLVFKESAVLANCNHDIRDFIMRPRFFLKAKKMIDFDENITYDFRLDWVKRIPLQNYPASLQQKICSRLFTGTGQIGGVIKLEENQDYISIPGFTEVKVGSDTYRCHPFYGTKGSWYDWAYFKFKGYEGNVPGRILMIFDLSNVGDMLVKLDTDLFDPDVHDLDNIPTYDHLQKEVWLVIQSAESSNAQGTLSDIHFTSSLITPIRVLSDDDLWLVPLSALVGPCYVVMDHDYISNSAQQNLNDQSSLRDNSSIAYVVHPLSSWGKEFLGREHQRTNENSSDSQDGLDEIVRPLVNDEEMSFQEQSQDIITKTPI